MISKPKAKFLLIDSSFDKIASLKYSKSIEIYGLIKSNVPQINTKGKLLPFSAISALNKQNGMLYKLVTNCLFGVLRATAIPSLKLDMVLIAIPISDIQHVAA